mmetsp:Transcript_32386/g.69023  ORF Transcript_32386/g.69023 Transcript_32386/m.69023 type:complete len:287 (-) Transcript_32386:107-967(-)
MPHNAVFLLAVLQLATALQLRDDTNVANLTGLDKHIPRAVAKEDQLVRFIHIPKAAGTSIGYFSLGVYSDGVHPNNKTWGVMDTSLLNQGDCHSSSNNRPECRSCVKDGVHSKAKGSPGSAKCVNWHIPPKLMEDGGAHFQGTTNFCVVRNPFERVISQYVYGGGNCTKEALNLQVVETLKDALKVASTGMVFADGACHWIPQSMYLQKGSEPGCKEIVFMDRGDGFESNFQELMHHLGVPGHLDEHMRDNHNKCSLGVDAFSHETIDLILQYFKDDFEEWPFYKP